MVPTVPQMLGDFRQALHGCVVAPGDPDFDDARQVWNAAVDRRPAVIVRCASTADVVTAIRLAREHDLEISVRGGAHNAAGTAVCDNGLMIDLSSLNAITVYPAVQRARVDGGVLLADLDRATQAHGLAIPAGMISHTGIGGLTLGGGMGWLTRDFGLTIDNLVSAEVVTADGQVLRAADSENSDLYWAIRGGGGNFGVVTSFEFQLHEIDPIADVALFFWGLDQGAQALRMCRDITAAMPPGINAVISAMNAPAAPFVPQEHRGRPGYGLTLAGFGSAAEHAWLVSQVRASAPLFDVVTQMPYVDLQKMLDELMDWGLCSYEKGAYLGELTDEVIDAITQLVARKSAPLSVLLLYRLDGAFSRVRDDDTAFGGGRSPRYAAFIVGIAPDAGLLTAERRWVREVWDALRPYALGSGAGYVNGTAELQGDRVLATYGEAKYERLARIKALYDPHNVFHMNANIRPA